MCSPCDTNDNYILMDNQLDLMRNWGCTMLFNESLPNTVPQYTDLCKKMKEKTCYTFPDRFIGVTSKQNLIFDLKLCAMTAGFALTLRTTDKRPSAFHEVTCTLYCQHGVNFQHRKNKSVRVAKTKWCVDVNEKCHFRLTIGLLKATQRWELKHTNTNIASSCDVHNGHLKLDISQIHTGIQLLSPTDIKLSKNCS